MPRNRLSDNDPRTVDFIIQVRVARLGDGFIALGKLAGQEFRGNRYDTRYRAAKDLFLQLSQEQNMDANLALDIASSGEDPTSLGFDTPDVKPVPALPSDGEIHAVGENGEVYRILVGTKEDAKHGASD